MKVGISFGGQEWERGAAFVQEAEKLGVDSVWTAEHVVLPDPQAPPSPAPPQMKLLDPAKVDLKKTYTTEFVKDLKIMP